MQHIIKFNTEEGITGFTTPELVGNLNCIIIDSMDKISFTINSSLGYLVLHNAEHFGIKYYAPRIVVRGPESLAIQKDQFDKFNLKETLDIRISGPKNADVSMIIRLD